MSEIRYQFKHTDVILWLREDTFYNRYTKSLERENIWDPFIKYYIVLFKICTVKPSNRANKDELNDIY